MSKIVFNKVTQTVSQVFMSVDKLRQVDPNRQRVLKLKTTKIESNLNKGKPNISRGRIEEENNGRTCQRVKLWGIGGYEELYSAH